MVKTLLELHPSSKYVFTGNNGVKDPNHLVVAYTIILRTGAWHKLEFIELAPKAGYLNKHGRLTDNATHNRHECPAKYAANCGAASGKVEMPSYLKG